MDKKEQNKILIPLIRKHLPQAIAEDIVGVQPMQSATSELFTMRSVLTSGWSEWKRVFVWLPVRSIHGKLLFGFVYKSEKHIYDFQYVADKEKTEFRYASSKDIFVEKLKGNDGS